MCGEDRSVATTSSGTAETPPRVWGRRVTASGLFMRSRNTPTCVGKTPRPKLITFAEKKHPHVCGEDSTCPMRSSDGSETPPRVWGRQIPLPARTERGRNTPTCVGKTGPLRPSYFSFKKHPHVCGEDAYPQALSQKTAETPPRVWGRLSLPTLQAF